MKVQKKYTCVTNLFPNSKKHFPFSFSIFGIYITFLFLLQKVTSYISFFSILQNLNTYTYTRSRYYYITGLQTLSSMSRRQRIELLHLVHHVYN